MHTACAIRFSDLAHAEKLGKRVLRAYRQHEVLQGVQQYAVFVYLSNGIYGNVHNPAISLYCFFHTNLIYTSEKGFLHSFLYSDS